MEPISGLVLDLIKLKKSWLPDHDVGKLHGVNLNIEGGPLGDTMMAGVQLAKSDKNENLNITL
jgi:hypothetical protein